MAYKFWEIYLVLCSKILLPSVNQQLHRIEKRWSIHLGDTRCRWAYIVNVWQVLWWRTCLPSLNLSFPKLNRLPGLLIPQSIARQPLGWLQRIESKLRVTLQAFQNAASTGPCRLHSHHDPQGSLCSCQTQLCQASPSPEAFLVLLPPAHPLLMKYCSLVPALHKCHLLGEFILPSEVSAFCLDDKRRHFLLWCHCFLSVGLVSRS